MHGMRLCRTEELKVFDKYRPGTAMDLSEIWSVAERARGRGDERVEYDLAYGIMRSHPTGLPERHALLRVVHLGSVSCAYCRAIRYFDTRALARDVHRIITKRQWRFCGRANDRMIAWAIGAPT